MCCSWLRCRRRVADSAEATTVEAFEEPKPEEVVLEEQELKPRKMSSVLHRLRSSFAFCTIPFGSQDVFVSRIWYYVSSMIHGLN